MTIKKYFVKNLNKVTLLYPLELDYIEATFTWALKLQIFQCPKYNPLQ